MGVEQIKRVVVLMLENRSFDHLMGALPGVDGASGQNVNKGADGTAFTQAERNNFSSPIKLDPKHEFTNVQVQLGASTSGGHPMSGFVIDAQATASKTSGYSDLPLQDQRAVVQSVMDHFSDGALPALHTLAKAFTVCDRWFASVPGPTWPNRFFSMMGSCHGQLEMPTGPLDAVVSVRAIADQIGKDSIFSVLTGVTHQIYSDYLVPLSILLKGSGARSSIGQFEQDVDAGKLPQFSWIEPDYSSNLARANSQHAPENVLRGDNLVARVYNKLRASPSAWRETLLVILHDEHGGFYDHVPPVPTVPADDSPSHPSFDYSYTGVRVPCMLVSPWVQRGVVSSDYEHTSLLAFLCDQFGLPQQRSLLGRRTAAADHFGAAPIWSEIQRQDVPDVIGLSTIEAAVGEEASADLDDQLPKLLNGLHAHAQGAATLSARRLVNAEAISAGVQNDPIAQAWQQGGALDNNTVTLMVAEVKRAFVDQRASPKDRSDDQPPSRPSPQNVGRIADHPEATLADYRALIDDWEQLRIQLAITSVVGDAPKSKLIQTLVRSRRRWELAVTAAAYAQLNAPTLERRSTESELQSVVRALAGSGRNERLPDFKQFAQSLTATPMSALVRHVPHLRAVLQDYDSVNAMAFSCTAYCMNQFPDDPQAFMKCMDGC